VVEVGTVVLFFLSGPGGLCQILESLLHALKSKSVDMQHM
jgi:hypothetical protein